MATPQERRRIEYPMYLRSSEEEEDVGWEDREEKLRGEIGGLGFMEGFRSGVRVLMGEEWWLW